MHSLADDTLPMLADIAQKALGAGSSDASPAIETESAASAADCIQGSSFHADGKGNACVRHAVTGVPCASKKRCCNCVG